MRRIIEKLHCRRGVSLLCALLSVEVNSNGALSKQENGFGELLLGQVADGKVKGNLLISSAAYSSAGLRAYGDVRYDKGMEAFVVTITIRPAEEDVDLLSSSFDVLPLNELSGPGGKPLFP